MKPARLGCCLALLVPLAACAGNTRLYPQPYIANGTTIVASPVDVAAFKTRTLHAPPSAELQGLAESYISRAVPHPSSVKFQSEFESVGKSTAVCGLVTYRDKYGAMTGWRPFFVEFTRKPGKGTEPGPIYDPEDELAKLCGPGAMTPQG